MSQLPRKIRHLTHRHALFQTCSRNKYICDGCEGRGSGARYSCHACDFDLHEFCSTCPSTLSFHMHPQHLLSLTIPSSQTLGFPKCSVCRERVSGFFYRCAPCGFHVHPLCTQYPESVRDLTHPAHTLKLQVLTHGRCVVCSHSCTSTRYRCEVCFVDVHLQCIEKDVECMATYGSNNNIATPSTSNPSAGSNLCDNNNASQNHAEDSSSSDGSEEKKRYRSLAKKALRVVATAVFGHGCMNS